MTDETQPDPTGARSATQRSREGSPAGQDPPSDPIQSRAAQLEAIVAQACRDNIDGATVQAQLQALGVSAAEAEDVLDQIIQRRAREASPDEPPAEPNRDNPNSLDAVAWALFQGKLDAARQVSSRNASGAQQLLQSALGSKQATNSSSGIPASVLAGAPFLAKLESGGHPVAQALNIGPVVVVVLCTRGPGDGAFFALSSELLHSSPE